MGLYQHGLGLRQLYSKKINSLSAAWPCADIETGQIIGRRQKTKPHTWPTRSSWLEDMNDYFTTLTDKAFQQPDLYKNKKIFMSNSLIDNYDKDHMLTYNNYPPVPFPELV